MSVSDQHRGARLLSQGDTVTQHKRLSAWVSPKLKLGLISHKKRLSGLPSGLPSGRLSGGRLSGLLSWLLSLSALIGCEEARRTPLTPAVSTPTPPVEQGGVEQGGVEQGGVEVTPQRPTLTRAPRRLTVAQLARSIEVVTGGVRWVEDFGQGPVDMLTFLAPTLGAPDFRNVTHENLEPSLLVSKFVQDGAQRVCEAWVALDRDPTRSAHTLVSLEGEGDAEGDAEWESLEEAHVRANLKRLLLRFFAYTARDEGDERVEALYRLFTMVAESAPRDPAGDAWLGVCLALMTDPEFLLY